MSRIVTDTGKGLMGCGCLLILGGLLIAFVAAVAVFVTAAARVN